MYPPSSARPPNYTVQVQNSSLIDVQRDVNIYNVSIDRSETGLLELCRASSTGAAFDSQERYPPPKCFPGTREELLGRIHVWINAGGVEGSKIFWLHGPAGAGKSAIVQTIAEKCAARKQLAASFFFTRSAPSRDSSQSFFTTIIGKRLFVIIDRFH